MILIQVSILGMRWKALELLMNLSQVSAQGDAAFLSFSSREVLAITLFWAELMISSYSI